MPTKIEWANRPGTTGETWNPVTGCDPVSPGCKNCYARRMARRLAGRYGYPEAPDEFVPMFHADRLLVPDHWQKPRTVFVASMGDLFHDDIEWIDIADVWKVMEQTPRHTYLVLTKRPQRMFEYIMDFWLHFQNRTLPNVWLGVSVEDQEHDWRIVELLRTPAAVRFLSLEPLLGPVDLSPYLCYNTHKEAKRDEKRGSLARIDQSRRVQDRQGGQNLETPGPELEEGRTPNVRWLPTSGENAERSTNLCRGTQAGVETLQRPNCSRYGDSPQKRGEGRQQAREFGDDDIFREYEACLPNGTEEPGWGAQSSFQVDRCPGERDQAEICGRGCDTRTVRDRVRRELPGNIEDRARGETPISTGTNERLHISSPNPESQERYKRPISLVVVGGETGPNARWMRPDWARSVRDQCQEAGVPFFFKQMSDRLPIPDDLMIREFPAVGQRELAIAD